ncbi:hypothetical protein GJAV_G00012680 [Gymnothorax javanicus]|nr:hypothetical protein GJAV_G00012680 [Gymnothorax javanicus]
MLTHAVEGMRLEAMEEVILCVNEVMHSCPGGTKGPCWTPNARLSHYGTGTSRTEIPHIPASTGTELHIEGSQRIGVPPFSTTLNVKFSTESSRRCATDPEFS